MRIKHIGRVHLAGRPGFGRSLKTQTQNIDLLRRNHKTELHSEKATRALQSNTEAMRVQAATMQVNTDAVKAHTAAMNRQNDRSRQHYNLRIP
jgi:hypothetical protein